MFPPSLAQTNCKYNCKKAFATDPFADVKKLGFSLIRLLVRAAPQALKVYAVALTRVCKPFLDHRHARVRIACIECVREIVACEDKMKSKGAGTEAIVDLIG